MDKARLEALLEQSQIPDTEKVKAVTAELQKDYFSKPEALLLLIEITTLHENPGMRQLAAVQALRIADKHWEKIPANHKETAIKTLLKSTVDERAAASTRHSKSRLAAKVIGLEIQKEGPAVQELLRNVISMNVDDAVSTREVGSYIVYALLENDPIFFSDHIEQMFELFSRTIKDAESAEVAVNTIKSVGAMLMIVDPNSDDKSVDAIQELFPEMVRILKATIDSGDAKDYRDIFEVLQSFLAYDSSLLSKHLKNLIQFMLQLATNKDLDDDARTQAVAFLSQCVHARRMKIQGMKDMGSQLMRAAVEIVSEIEDDDDDDDEMTPGRTGLALIDQLASDLPPRQAIIPLLDDFPSLARHADPGHRRAAILSLGTAAEGAPDFISTQLKPLLPLVVGLLNDPDDSVRHASLVGLIHLADEMAGELAPEHAGLVEALLKNLEAAKAMPSKKSVKVVRAVCGALDSLGVELSEDVTKAYGPRLIAPLGAFLQHEDYSVKSAAAGAIGSLALSMGEDFKPYFQEVMSAFGAYVMIKDSEDELSLRSSVCDSMGRIAAAVGAEAFQPYVMDLMKASEEGLHLDNARLKETSFILWASLAKVYGEKFAEFLPGVFTGLLATLELEEEEISLEGLVDDSEAGDVLVVGGKKLRLKKSDEKEEDEADLGDMDDDDDDSWSDLPDFTGATAIAMEQEIALEVLGDVISMSCDLEALKTYLEPTLEKLQPLADHSFEGCRKAALSTLWRAYARVWSLLEEHRGLKWQPGAPAENPMPDPVLEKIGHIVCKSTQAIWPDDAERTVVTEINRNVAAVLKACGPAILGLEDMERQVITVVASIITRSHPCQQDLGDEEDEQKVEEGSAEYDWLTIDTALDVVLGMAEAMGPKFIEHWKTLQKPIIAFCSSKDSLERSTAMGVIAEVIKYVGAEITPFTESILQILMHRISDPDMLTKSNTAYAVGQLIANSTDNSVIGAYPKVLEKLEPALAIKESRMQDNIAGCFARMIMRKPDPEVIAKLFPLVASVLPLKEDHEENSPVFSCIFKLYEIGNPTVQELTPQLVSVFEAVLGPPEEQLEKETRELVQKIVQMLYQHQPALFQNNPGVLKLAGAL